MKFLAYLLILCGLTACDNSASLNTLRIGTMSGPEAEVMETAKQVAENKYGLNIKIITFDDYALPNEALENNTLDANVFQHLPYLKAAILEHGYDLQAIGRTFVYPMGLYSKKYKSLEAIPDKSIIAVPKDPANEMRAFILLENAHLITIKEATNSGRPILESNPKHLQFQEEDAKDLVNTLPTVAAAVINTTFAIPAGLHPSKDALYAEGKDSPYANIMVIRKDTKKRKQLELFLKALNSEPVKIKAQRVFGDDAIPAW